LFEPEITVSPKKKTPKATTKETTNEQRSTMKNVEPIKQARPSFLNFQVDHMTLLLKPEMYNVSYLLFRVIFGVRPEDILYNKSKEWVPGEGQKSMTFATRIGTQQPDDKAEMNNTIIAVVQPTEPATQPSHVRKMLSDHQAAAHWQHIALRTPDLVAFHRHALDRGVRFITPILRDESEDLIQVFSGEWYFPGITASGMFFEFVQRNPTADSIKMLEESNRESWFRDKTFLGLYGEKEREYQSGDVTPFVDFELFNKLLKLVGDRQVLELTEKDIENAETIMLEHAAKNGEN